jgi:hypothetical protein
MMTVYNNRYSYDNCKYFDKPVHAQYTDEADPELLPLVTEAREFLLHTEEKYGSVGSWFPRGLVTVSCYCTSTE